MTDERFTDRDLRRNEDPRAIAGAVSSATGAGVGGALGFATLGPIGSALGVLAGAIGGWWAGRGIQHALEDLDREDDRFRRAHEHMGARRPYEEVRHAYQLGYLAGRNPQHARSTFAAVEAELRSAWVQAHAHDEQPVSWDDVREQAEAGYELAWDRAQQSDGC